MKDMISLSKPKKVIKEKDIEKDKSNFKKLKKKALLKEKRKK